MASNFFRPALASDKNENVFEDSFGKGCDNIQWDRDPDPGLIQTPCKQAGILTPAGGGCCASFISLSPSVSPISCAWATRDTKSSNPELSENQGIWKVGEHGTQVAHDGVPPIRSQGHSSPPTVNPLAIWPYENPVPVTSTLLGFLVNAKEPNTNTFKGQLTPQTSKDSEPMDTLVAK